MQRRHLRFSTLCMEEVGRLKRTLWGAFELISSEDYSLPCGNTTETSSTVGETLRELTSPFEFRVRHEYLVSFLS